MFTIIIYSLKHGLNLYVVQITLMCVSLTEKKLTLLKKFIQRLQQSFQVRQILGHAALPLFKVGLRSDLNENFG